MKRVSFLVLALAALLTFCACGAGNAPSAAQAPVLQESGAAEAAPVPQSDPESAPAQTEDGGAGNRVLVVYFSRTGENYTVGTISKGNTAIVGDLIAERTGADVFEIVPVTPYPDSYAECLDVATQEQRSNARPEYVGEVEDWENYDIVFFGYPIWWGDLPMISYTFLENHDWNGKTVIPFNTHEGSGQGGTQRKVEKACVGATMADGLAIRGNTAQNDAAATQKSVDEWLAGMDFFG